MTASLLRPASSRRSWLGACVFAALRCSLLKYSPLRCSRKPRRSQLAGGHLAGGRGDVMMFPSPASCALRDVLARSRLKRPSIQDAEGRQGLRSHLFRTLLSSLEKTTSVSGGASSTPARALRSMVVGALPTHLWRGGIGLADIVAKSLTAPTRSFAGAQAHEITELYDQLVLPDNFSSSPRCRPFTRMTTYARHHAPWRNE